MSDISRRDSLRVLAGGAALMSLGGVAMSPKLMAQTIDSDGNEKSALIVVDVQNDFVPGGSLAVKGGHEVVPIINELSKRFKNVVITQDWHNAGHASFASSYPGKKPFETTELYYGPQVLWPDHCVQGTKGAELVDGLDIPHAQLIIRKGFHPKIDSYSGFFEADQKTPTGLQSYLKERGITTLYVVGLATDFCVAWTAMDGVKSGFTVSVIEDAARAIDLNGSLDAAWKAMDAKGVARIQSSAVLT
ncbi:bifunctional nicotinamidase/pyrazinamidase [Marinomonas sp.]|nr:bifunctional nicotinamidase/pyrazinamidase [Marinomonas sp.]MDB4836984.1 bifunctional nicotinamidase/pyrazinamidase [Marinomonas sp.]